MDTPLNDYIAQIAKQGRQLNEYEILNISQQICKAIKYLADQGVTHCDISTKNIFIHNNHIRLFGFDIVRFDSEKENILGFDQESWQQNLRAGFYPAPEILLNSSKITSKADVFALGCLICELYDGNPIFSAQNQHQQLVKYCQNLGSPTHDSWPEGFRLAIQKNFQFPQSKGVDLQHIVNNAPGGMLFVLERMLQINPDKRISPEELIDQNLLNYQERKLEILPILQTPSQNSPQQVTFEDSPSQFNQTVKINGEAKFMMLKEELYDSGKQQQEIETSDKGTTVPKQIQHDRNNLATPQFSHRNHSMEKENLQQKEIFRYTTYEAITNLIGDEKNQEDNQNSSTNQTASQKNNINQTNNNNNFSKNLKTSYNSQIYLQSKGDYPGLQFQNFEIKDTEYWNKHFITDHREKLNQTMMAINTREHDYDSRMITYKATTPNDSIKMSPILRKDNYGTGIDNFRKSKEQIDQKDKLQLNSIHQKLQKEEIEFHEREAKFNMTHNKQDFIQKLAVLNNNLYEPARVSSKQPIPSKVPESQSEFIRHILLNRKITTQVKRTREEEGEKGKQNNIFQPIRFSTEKRQTQFTNNDSTIEEAGGSAGVGIDTIKKKISVLEPLRYQDKQPSQISNIDPYSFNHLKPSQLASVTMRNSQIEKNQVEQLESLYQKLRNEKYQPGQSYFKKQTDLSAERYFSANNSPVDNYYKINKSSNNQNFLNKSLNNSKDLDSDENQENNNLHYNLYLNLNKILIPNQPSSNKNKRSPKVGGNEKNLEFDGSQVENRQDSKESDQNGNFDGKNKKSQNKKSKQIDQETLKRQKLQRYMPLIKEIDGLNIGSTPLQGAGLKNYPIILKDTRTNFHAKSANDDLIIQKD